MKKSSLFTLMLFIVACIVTLNTTSANDKGKAAVVTFQTGTLPHPQRKPIARKRNRMEKPVAFESMRAIRISDMADGSPYSMPSKKG